MKKPNWFSLTGLAIGCCILLFCFALPVVKPIITNSKVQVIIDPGHGYPDGGAVGLDGTTEQKLNLEIATRLSSLYSDGQYVMTRADEQGIATEGSSIREKKISDMKQRVQIANQYKDAMIVSIHMNTFSESSVHGCQVFYRKDDEQSKKIAFRLQNDINTRLQPDNPKQVKTIDESLYLFANTENSAILIECGFLTNEQELKKLKDKAYQEELVQLIYKAATGEDDING